MAFYDDEEKDKEEGTVSEDALGEVLDIDADEDEDIPIVPPVEEDEKWE